MSRAKKTKVYDSWYGRSIIFSIILLIIFYGLFYTPVKHGSAVGKQIEFSDTISVRGDLDSISGPYILHIFSSWCPACKTQHHVIRNLSRKTDFKIVGLTRKDHVSGVNEFLISYGDPYNVLLLDQGMDISNQLGVKLVPTTFVISAKGKVLYQHVGRISYEELHDAISRFF